MAKPSSAIPWISAIYGGFGLVLAGGSLAVWANFPVVSPKARLMTESGDLDPLALVAPLVGFFSSTLLLAALLGIAMGVGAAALYARQSWGRSLLEGTTWVSILYGSCAACLGFFLLRALDFSMELQLIPLAAGIPSVAALFAILPTLRSSALKQEIAGDTDG